jgi:hypothetical protein
MPPQQDKITISRPEGGRHPRSWSSGQRPASSSCCVSWCLMPQQLRYSSIQIPQPASQSGQPSRQRPGRSDSRQRSLALARKPTSSVHSRLSRNATLVRFDANMSTKAGVNTLSGYGNFHMKPNGIFFISGDKAAERDAGSHPRSRKQCGGLRALHICTEGFTRRRDDGNRNGRRYGLPMFTPMLCDCVAGRFTRW